MSKSIQSDLPYLKMGAENEKLYTPIFQKIFDKGLKKTKSYWSVIDFKSYKMDLEMKSRTNCYNKYPNTMFGANKLKYAWGGVEKYGKRVIFAFAFTDGLYYWELTRENYEKCGGDKAIYVGGTNERGYDDYKDHFHIPIDQLIKISDIPSFVPDELKYKTLDNTPQTVFKDLTGVCLIKPKITKEHKCLIELEV